MATTIVTKNSSTAAAVPTAAQLVQGELAVNVADKRLYTEDNGGSIVELGVNPSAEITANAGIALPDSQKATFGAGDDLQIYHDGSNSYIVDAGTGDLYFRSASNLYIGNAAGTQSYITAADGGAVDLRYNGSAKLATTSTGIDVTGTATMDSLTVDTSSVGGFKVTNEATSGVRLTAYQGTTNSNVRTAYVDAQEFVVSTGAPTGTTVTERMRIDLAGNVGIGTSSPSKQLEVQNAAAGTAIRASNNGGGYAELACTSNATSTAELNFTNSLAMLGGNVGIGTSSPSLENGSGLVVYNATAPRISLKNSTTGTTGLDGVDIAMVSSDAYFFNREAGAVVLGTSSFERMRIDSSGNVGIGTSSINGRLEIKKATASNETMFGIEASGVTTTTLGSITYDQSDDSMRLLNNSHFGGTTLRLGTRGNDNLVINYSGNVGIGTASPDAPLHISKAATGINAATTVLKLSSVDTSTAQYVGFQTQRDNSAGQGLNILVTNVSGTVSEAMRITPDGNLLVSKTDTSIGAVGHTFTSDGEANHTCSGGAALYLNRQSSFGNVAQFYQNNDLVGSISVTSTATTYNTSSDQRLKENIADADDAGSKIDAIQVRKYDWKADGSHQDYGMIAQELQLVAPEAVTVPEDSEEMMGVDYSKLVPMLIKEIQSLRNRVAQLETGE